jgi:hypothetical protein
MWQPASSGTQVHSYLDLKHVIDSERRAHFRLVVLVAHIAVELIERAKQESAELLAQFCLVDASSG